jgi:mono/diheme cytochrome c family protein
MTPPFWAAIIGLEAAALAGLGAFALQPTSPVSMEGSPGHLLYLAHCASCHGANLEGQPHWKVRRDDGRLPAPPHDASGHTWHHSDDALFRITKEGLAAVVPGYETDMPAFGETLTDDEIRAVLEFIKSKWPERERQYQQAR